MTSIYPIQKIVADMTDQLLDITNHIQHLLSCYTTEDQTVLRIQTQVLIEQCKRLQQKAAEIQNTLDILAKQDMSPTKRTSLSVTQQLLKQNQFLIKQKQDLLTQLQNHQKNIKTKQMFKQKMDQIIELQTLQQKLYQLFPSNDSD